VLKTCFGTSFNHFVIVGRRKTRTGANAIAIADRTNIYSNIIILLYIRENIKEDSAGDVSRAHNISGCVGVCRHTILQFRHFTRSIQYYYYYTISEHVSFSRNRWRSSVTIKPVKLKNRRQQYVRHLPRRL